MGIPCTVSERSERRQHEGEDLEAQVLFVAQAVGATLEHADLVIEPFDESETDLVLRPAVGSDAVPVALDHLGELLVWREALPLEACTPVVEEAARPALAFVAPELTESLLQHIGRIQPFVGGEQCLQRAPAVDRKVLAVREQRVLLPFDEAAILAG